MPQNNYQYGKLTQKEIDLAKKNGHLVRVDDKDTKDNTNLEILKKYVDENKEYSIENINITTPNLQKHKDFQFIKHQSNLPLFPHLPNLNDLEQRRIGECFFDSETIGFVNSNSVQLLHMMKDNADRVYVKLYDYDKDGNKVPYIYDIEKSTIQGTNLIYKKFNNHQLWAAILEKAYAIHQQRRFKEATTDHKSGLPPIKAPLTSFINFGYSHDVGNAFFETKASSMIFNEVNDDDNNFRHPALFYHEIILNKNSSIIHNEIEQLNKLNISEDKSELFNKIKNYYSLMLVGGDNFKNNLERIGKNLDSLESDKQLKTFIQKTSPVAYNCLKLSVNLYNQNNKDNSIVKNDEYTSSLALFLQEALATGCVVTCSTKQDFGNKIPGMPELISNGMASRHAYALLSVQTYITPGKELTPNDIALRLYNPWGMYSAEYNNNNQLTSGIFSDTKNSRNVFNKNHKILPEQPNTMNSGAPTVHIINNQSDQTQFYAVSEITLKDFLEYFDQASISPLPEKSVLCNQLLIITSSCMRLGFQSAELASSATSLYKLLLSDNDLNIQETFNHAKNILNSIHRTFKDTELNIYTADYFFREIAKLSGDNINDTNKLIREFASIINKVRQETPETGYYDFISQLNDKISKLDKKLTPKSKELITTLWNNKIAKLLPTQQILIANHQEYKNFLDNLLCFLTDDLKYTKKFYPREINSINDIQNLIKEVSDYNKAMITFNNRKTPIMDLFPNQSTLVPNENHTTTPETDKQKLSKLMDMKNEILQLIESAKEILKNNKNPLSSASIKLDILKNKKEILNKIDFNNLDISYNNMQEIADSVHNLLNSPGYISGPSSALVEISQVFYTKFLEQKQNINQGFEISTNKT
ncbi:C2 family cysteine protease [Thiotrichales bacterium 19X7-9]|nr:C2 family cysteine protease [Thiotrichales bacterium 19X7-9]